MKTKKIFFFITLFLITISSLQAQIIDPAHWKHRVKVVDDTHALLIMEAEIDPGWHMYSQFFEDGGPVKMTFDFKQSPNYKRIGKVKESPKPHEEIDKIFDVKVAYFDKKARLTQKIQRIATQDFTVKASVHYQVCSDESCVNFDQDFEFKVPGATGNAKVQEKDTASAATTTSSIDSSTNKETEETNEGDDEFITDTTPKTEEVIEKESHDLTGKTVPPDMKNKSLWLFFWFSFLAGLAAIFTPCVFPMIPMTVSFFMHSQENKAKAKLQASFYGISIILIYTVIGTLVAILFGAEFANFLSTHWLPNILFFLIFLIFAASFLGMFEITLPSWMINKMDSKADKGGWLGPFFMAFTLVLVSFSCTGPLVGAILVASAGGEVIQPIIGMFGFSLAFALPFTLFALFPRWLNKLPKSGGWLNSVKVVLGFIELALGLKFLSIADQTYHWGILDREIYLALWIVIFSLMGLYLLGKLKFANDSDLKFISVPRLGLAIATFAFVVYMIPGMFGAPLKMLSGYIPPQSTHDFDLHQIIRDNASPKLTEDDHTIYEKPKYDEFLHLPHGLKGYFDYEQGMRVAKKLNKPVFLDFTGHGCVNCREMEANVWSNPEVLKRLKQNYVIIALYVDDKTKLEKSEWVEGDDGKIKKTLGAKYADFQISRFGVNAQPYYVLLDNSGNKLIEPRAYNLDVDKFIKFLDKGVEEYKAKKE